MNNEVRDVRSLPPADRRSTAHITSGAKARTPEATARTAGATARTPGAMFLKTVFLKGDRI